MVCSVLVRTPPAFKRQLCLPFLMASRIRLLYLGNPATFHRQCSTIANILVCSLYLVLVTDITLPIPPAFLLIAIRLATRFYSFPLRPSPPFPLLLSHVCTHRTRLPLSATAPPNSSHSCIFSLFSLARCTRNGTFFFWFTRKSFNGRMY